jgi:hypothetical protein
MNTMTPPWLLLLHGGVGRLRHVQRGSEIQANDTFVKTGRNGGRIHTRASACVVDQHIEATMCLATMLAIMARPASASLTSQAMNSAL